MAYLKLKGSKTALKKEKVQWEIIRQVILQSDRVIREIKVGNEITGTVHLEENEKLTPLINLLKAQSVKVKYKGELDVFEEVTEKMTSLFSSRMQKLDDSINQVLNIDDTIKKAYPKEWFKPPIAVANNAKLGLKWRRKYGRGGLSTKEAGALGIGSGVQRAVDLKHRDYLSPDTIKRMVAFFSRHKKNKDSRTKKGEPGAGLIAWLLWGGDEGETWSNLVLDKMKQADLNKAEDEDAGTPAEPQERIKGSLVNREESASSVETASSIILDADILESLKKKTENHNRSIKHEWQRVSLPALKAVFRRGAGAFSTSHRPSQNRQSWAYARVNAFLKVALGKGKRKYTQDDDLLNEKHPRNKKKG